LGSEFRLQREAQRKAQTKLAPEASFGLIRKRLDT
jgi:hypothetical protein